MVGGEGLRCTFEEFIVQLERSLHLKYRIIRHSVINTMTRACGKGHESNEDLAKGARGPKAKRTFGPHLRLAMYGLKILPKIEHWLKLFPIISLTR